MISIYEKPDARSILRRVGQKINPIIIFSILGILFGIFVLHPLSMIIIDHSGNSFRLGYYFSYVTRPMGIYFTIIGLCSGLISGLLAHKIFLQKRTLEVKNMQLQKSEEEKETLLRILTHDLVN